MRCLSMWFGNFRFNKYWQVVLVFNNSYLSNLSQWKDKDFYSPLFAITIFHQKSIRWRITFLHSCNLWNLSKSFLMSPLIIFYQLTAYPPMTWTSKMPFFLFLFSFFILIGNKDAFLFKQPKAKILEEKRLQRYKVQGISIQTAILRRLAHSQPTFGDLNCSLNTPHLTYISI